MKIICPLCDTPSPFFYKDTQAYHRCPQCYGIFVAPKDLPKAQEEKQRYELHDTDTQDEGYRKFVSPITLHVSKDFPLNAKGLDYGAGTSAIISCVLQEEGYNIKNYDPYFHPHKELLEQKYDFITSCEVIEHFYHPKKEFEKLFEMLHVGGRLYLMTDIYDERDFASWYYKNDPTHVFLYHRKTFEYITKAYGFQSYFIDKRLIVLVR
jgi:Zn-finger nucleic acid-binding protein